jgi:hypothetical protein
MKRMKRLSRRKAGDGWGGFDRDPEVLQDLADHLGILDGRDKAQAAATAGRGEHRRACPAPYHSELFPDEPAAASVQDWRAPYPHARYYMLALAESRLTQRLFGQILGRIERFYARNGK